jgi:hypothetical protein
LGIEGVVSGREKPFFGQNLGAEPFAQTSLGRMLREESLPNLGPSEEAIVELATQVSIVPGLVLHFIFDHLVIDVNPRAQMRQTEKKLDVAARSQGRVKGVARQPLASKDGSRQDAPAIVQKEPSNRINPKLSRTNEPGTFFRVIVKANG